MLYAALIASSIALTEVPDSVSPTAGLDAEPRERHLHEARVATRRNTALTGSAPGWRVSAADIELRGATTLTEILRTLAGVSVKDYGGVGGLKTVSIRGFGAQHTAVCYDGIVMGDCQNGQVDIGRFALDNIGSIRVDIGGSDNIFRPARLAASVGTVELTSRTPRPTPPAPRTGGAECPALEGPSEAKVTAPPVRGAGGGGVTYASFNTVRPYANVSLPLTPRWTLSAWGDYLHSAGDYPFVLHNGSVVTHERRLGSQVSAFNGEVRAEGAAGRRGTIVAKALVHDSSRGLPGSVVLYTQHPTEHLWDRSVTGSVRYDLTTARDWRLRTTLSYTNAWNRYTDEAPTTYATPMPPIDDRYRQQQATLSTIVLWKTRHHWSASLAEDVEAAYLTNTIPEAVTPCARLTSFTALSGKYEAARFDAVATLLYTAAMPLAMDDGHAAHRLTKSLSASCKPLDGADWKLRASYRESFRLPTFNDLYYLRVGNRNLRPERAQQFNVGTTYTFNLQPSTINHKPYTINPTPYTLCLTADVYYNNVRDKIVAIPTLFAWHTRNVGRVAMLGTDISLSMASSPVRWLRLGLGTNYSLQYAVDVTTSEAKNYRDQIPYVPRHSGNVCLTAETPWCNAAYTLSAVGERYALAQNTPAYRLAPYADHTVSLNRSFRLGSALTLHASIEGLNLAGRNYEVIKYYPMAGRNYRVTLRLSLSPRPPQ